MAREHARGKSVYSFWYILYLKQSLKYLWHIGGFNFIFFYDDISDRRSYSMLSTLTEFK